MESEINFYPVLMQEDILHYLAPLLNGQILKEARLVCKIWNRAVEKEIKNRLKLVAFRHGKTQPDPEALNNENTCHEILANVDFCHSTKELLWVMTQERLQNGVDCSWPLPEGVGRPYHHERSCLQFFRNIGSSTAIKRVKVFDGCQVHSVVEALNEGLLPNLQVLEICRTDDNSYEEAYEEGPIQNFDTATLSVPLPSLTWLSIETDCLKEKHGGFYQRLINAASNLQLLSCAVIFDPSRLSKLREFNLFGRTSCSFSSIQYEQDKVHERLSPLKDQLHFLSLDSIILQKEFLHFPNVTKLEMKNVEVNSIVPGSLASYFPSVVRLTLHDLHNNETFLQRGLPETLKIFKFDGECLADVHDNLPHSKFLQNLHLLAPKLKLVVCNLDQLNHRKERLNGLFKTTFPNLIINLEKEMGFVEVMETFATTTVQGQPEERGEVLEIRNGLIPKEMIQVRVGRDWLNVVDNKSKDEVMEHEDPIEWFAIASNKLFKKFKLVRFFHFKIEAELMSRLEEVIRQRKWAVEFFA